MLQQFNAIDPQHPLNPIALQKTHQLFWEGDNRLWVGLYQNQQGKKSALLGFLFGTNHLQLNQLVKQACLWARNHSCDEIVGPIDGNTWFSYRTHAEAYPEVFDNEPRYPSTWNSFFLENKFVLSESYFSTYIPAEKLSQRKLSQTLLTRYQCELIVGPSLTQIQKYLPGIHQLSEQVFQTPYIEPMPWDIFEDSYQKILAKIPLRHCMLLINHQNKLVGYLLGFPSQTQSNTLMIKTVASAPNYPGLGAMMVSHFHQLARNENVKGVFHLLMHEENTSTQIAAQGAQNFRRYYLWKKTL